MRLDTLFRRLIHILQYSLNPPMQLQRLRKMLHLRIDRRYHYLLIMWWCHRLKRFTWLGMVDKVNVLAIFIRIRSIPQTYISSLHQKDQWAIDFSTLR